MITFVSKRIRIRLTVRQFLMLGNFVIGAVAILLPGHGLNEQGRQNVPSVIATPIQTLK